MRNTADKGVLNRTRLVAICGNPNCGKTTIFNAITGLSQKVGNYPGVTVEKVSGQFSVSESSEKITIVDVPGTYSLAAFSPDEYIAVSSLYGSTAGEILPDAIISVVDATNLERSLYLFQQAQQIGVPMLVALNMVDIAKRNGIEIDIDKLSEELGGTPVVPVVGNQGKGIPELKSAIDDLLNSNAENEIPELGILIEEVISELQEYPCSRNRTRAEYLRIIFDVDGPAEKDFFNDSKYDKNSRKLQNNREKIIQKYGSLSNAETGILSQRANKIVNKVVRVENKRRKTRTEQLDLILLNPIAGPLILAAIMVFIFQSIFSWAVPFIDFIDSAFNSVATIVESNMGKGPLRSLLVDGVIGGVGSVLVFIPQIVILFLFISFLEDSGYMARAAFLVDRMFRWCGLSGKSFIPLLSSFACAVPGIMATRTIEDRKLRVITILVAPLMSCSARLPIYTIMIAAFIPYKPIFGIINLQGLVLAGLYLLGLVVAVMVAFILKKFMLKTEKGTFLMEIPSYKVPTIQATFIRVYTRVKMFVIRAGTVIMAITVIIWALSYFPRSENLNQKYEQIIAVEDRGFEMMVEKISNEINSIVITNMIPDKWYENISTQIAEVQSVSELERLNTTLTSENAVQNRIALLLINKKELQFDYEKSIQKIENSKASENLANSYFGRLGRLVQPIFEPLGWDWKISMAVLASFPAREVIIATLGTIYNLGGDVDEDSNSLISMMRSATYDSGEKKGQYIFTPSVAMSVMIFFALCCQCGATLVTIRAETGKTSYSVGTFLYMTITAYIMALIVYQILHGMGY